MLEARAETVAHHLADIELHAKLSQGRLNPDLGAAALAVQRLTGELAFADVLRNPARSDADQLRKLSFGQGFRHRCVHRPDPLKFSTLEV